MREKLNTARDYVRVIVLSNVSMPLKITKEVQLPTGKWCPLVLSTKGSINVASNAND